jgi:hypothetical protein
MTQDRGVALVIVLLAISVASTLGLGLVVATTMERLAGANYTETVHTTNAADAALEVAAHELGALADWNAVLAGGIQSRFVEGAAPIDLTRLTNDLICGRPAGCTEAQRSVSTKERPWGANNPAWKVFLRAPLSRFLNLQGVSSDTYIVVWVGDDARETDDDPLRDGSTEAGGNVVRLRAEAFGRTGARRAVEADVVRHATGIHVQSWRLGAGVVP